MRRDSIAQVEPDDRLAARFGSGETVRRHRTAQPIDR